jgi:hypothetical protein
MGNENKFESEDCIAYSDDCRRLKRELLPIDDKWSNLTEVNVDEAKRLLGKIRACIEIDSKLQDKYENCISFLLLVLTHVCELEFEDVNDISLCKKIVTFNSRFYPNPDKYVVANPEDRATAESLLQSAILTLKRYPEKPITLSMGAENLKRLIMHSYGDSDDIPQFVKEFKRPRFLKGLR